jgi:hypothetical protein
VGGAGNDSLVGGAGNDSMTGGTGVDTFVLNVAAGAETDTITDFGDGADSISGTLGTGDQLNVTMAGTAFSAATIAATTGVVSVTGSSGNDSITGGIGNDTLSGGAGNDSMTGGAGVDTFVLNGAVGAETDTITDWGNGTDVFSGTLGSGDQLNVTMTGTTFSAATIAATNGVVNVTGSSSNDSITGGIGSDTLSGGIGNDTISGGTGGDNLSGGAGVDTFRFVAGDSTYSVGGSGNTGTITGYDVITDYTTGAVQDLIDVAGTASLGSSSTTNDSTLTIGGSVVNSHSISSGIISFSSAATYSVGTAFSLTSLSNVAAVVQYLGANDWGSAGATVAFNATISGVNHAYVYTQTGNAAGGGQLIDLSNLANPLASLAISSSTTINQGYVAPIAIDLNGDGVNYLNQSANVKYDFNQDGTAEATAWVAGTDGLLAMQNPDGSLSITFSTQAGETDLQGLAKVYDVNLDGILNQQDGSFNSFGVWQDVNSDGKVEAGEFKSLTDAGITSLDLVSDGQAYTTAGGDVQVSGGTTYTRADGSVGIDEDVSFSVSNPDTSLTLTGQADNSVITGSQSDDTLTGTLGADVFKWNLNDQGTEGAPANDTITDFSIAQGDSLDLRDLLTGEHDGSLEGVANNLTSYLHFEKSTSGTDTIVSISSNGQFTDGFDSSKVDQTITLANVDLVGTSSQQQIVDDLLKQQVIKLDQ